MKTHKTLLGLAVVGASLTMIGCGGSSSSSGSPSTPAPDAPPKSFTFDQTAEDALAEMKGIPEQAFPAELYDFLRTHLIEGENTSGVSRFADWVTHGISDPVNTAPPRNCGANTFGTVKTSDGFLAPSTNNTYMLTDVTNDEIGQTLGGNASLYRSAVTVIFTDCEIVSTADNTEVVATITGPVILERTWIGESGSPSANNRMDNFSFRFGYDNPVSITDLNDVDYELQGTFIDTHLFDEITASEQQAIGNLTTVSSHFVRSRLAANDYKGMYAFDAPNLRIMTTPNGGTASQVQFNNFASVFVAPTVLGNNTPDVYSLYVESPYRGDVNAEASAIVFGSGEDAETLFIETLSNGGNDQFITAIFDFVGDETAFLRGRSVVDTARLDCPTNASIGYSTTPSAPLVAGLSFLDVNSVETVRVFVDENNTQTDRDPAAAISTVSHDATCRDDENGPTKFIPLPGLGSISYKPLALNF